jgi:hypothetical protein
MKGLDLSELYYHTFGVKMIDTQFPAYRERIAVGLVGLGSECFGFDDDISTDHDWGPGFCLWLEENDFKAIGSELQKAYDTLPDFMGIRRQKSQWGDSRIGVLEIGAFYAFFIGRPNEPEGLGQWFRIPEASLAACTNGRIFSDPIGIFSIIRKKLLNHYPEDVRLKKIAARCVTAAQSGQYNYARSLRRNADYSAFQSLSKFCEDALSLVFLLNKRYMPFYKWAFTAASSLPILGSYVSHAINNIIQEKDSQKRVTLIEMISMKLIEELIKQNLSDSKSDFLVDHGHRVHEMIQDENLKKLDILWSGA